MCYTVGRAAYLSILEAEDKLDLVTIDYLLLDLGRNPALGGIGLPGLGADIVRGRHGGWMVLCCGGVSAKGGQRSKDMQTKRGGEMSDVTQTPALSHVEHKQQMVVFRLEGVAFSAMS